MHRAALVVATALAGLGCGHAPTDGDDAPARDAADGDAAAGDAGADAAAIDAAVADARPVDARPVDAAIDAIPPTADLHVHIAVSNTCAMTVTPMAVTVPANQTLYLDWHNHSVDYPVDVWMSYGGGFLDLPTGATWDEPIGHCSTPLVHDEYADISTACSSFRFLIHCN